MRLVVPLFFMVMVACSSTSERYGDQVYPPRPEEHPVIVVETEDQLPKDRGPWLKIGEVTATDNGWGGDVIKMLMPAARRMGGDAIVQAAKYKTTQTFGIGWKSLAGAIVWRDASSLAEREKPPEGAFR